MAELWNALLVTWFDKWKILALCCQAFCHQGNEVNNHTYIYVSTYMTGNICIHDGKAVTVIIFNSELTNDISAAFAVKKSLSQFEN